MGVRSTVSKNMKATVIEKLCFETELTNVLKKNRMNISLILKSVKSGLIWKTVE